MGLLNSIKEFKKKINSLEKVYIIFMIFLVFVPTISIAYLEYYPIGKINQEIAGLEKDVEFTQNIIDYDNYLELTRLMDYNAGQSVGTQWDGKTLNKAAEVYTDIGLHLQRVIVAECWNTNRASAYLNEEINCSKVDGVGALKDDYVELNKLKLNKKLLMDVNENLKKDLSNKDSAKENLTNLRNLLYLIFVILSSVGVGFKYFIQKYYATK